MGGRKERWMDWAMKQMMRRTMNPAMPRTVRFPSIYANGNNARQIAYLLSGISVLARLAGYSGLCVLLDEAESYSSLPYPYQRPKANFFFSAVVRAALGGLCGQNRSCRSAPTSLPGVFHQVRWGPVSILPVYRHPQRHTIGSLA